MISVAIVDDHPAMQIGLRAALRAEPGLVPVGSAATPEQIYALLYRTRPDVVLLDYHLPGTDGLTVCRRLKSDVLSPGVLLYSAFADESLLMPAIVAGADGVINKSAPPRELYDAVRVVAGGGRSLPAPPRALLRAACEQIDAEDQPILGMLMDGTPLADIAATLRLRPGDLDGRLMRMLDRLRVPARAYAAPP